MSAVFPRVQFIRCPAIDAELFFQTAAVAEKTPAGRQSVGRGGLLRSAD